MASIINTTLFHEYFGLPIQIFRAFCAFLSAISAIALFKVLREAIETNMLELSSAVEHSGASIIITDREGIIEYVNPAFEEQTGFTKEEAIGKKPNILKSGIQSIEFYRDKLWATILSGKTFRDYFVNKKKNGELYHQYKAIAPIKDKKGNISNFVSTGKDVTEHMLLKAKLEELSVTDSLTGLANRLKFDEVLSYSIDRAKRYKVGLSVIMFDIDHFKKINDKYGHLCGDDVLKTIAKIGKESVRTSDIVARWGGEEFIILQPDIPANKAPVLAERLRQAIESHNFEKVGRVTASFGVTNFKEDDTDDSFIKRVDDALYLAKKNGRNRVEVSLIS
jgi:diguanylate cyclase (GGDEF)-like protein/PAS domain S-box-containing protein